MCLFILAATDAAATDAAATAAGAAPYVFYRSLGPPTRRIVITV